MAKANYIPNRNIKSIKVQRSGKTTDIDGSKVLDGAYVKKSVKYAQGGNSEKSTIGSEIVGSKRMYFIYDSKSGKKSKYYNSKADAQKFADSMNSEYAQGGGVDGYEIVVVAKGLEKDGRQIIKDRFYINSNSVTDAKNIAKGMWEKEMYNSDFYIVDILTDAEYRTKYLSKEYAQGGSMYEEGGNTYSYCYTIGGL